MGGVGGKALENKDLFFAAKLGTIFYKADCNHHGRADQAREEHDLQQPHTKDRHRHGLIVAWLEPGGTPKCGAGLLPDRAPRGP